MTTQEIEVTTIDNAKAIGELTLIAKQTSKDVDKLITHLDNAPLSRTVSLEKRVGKVEEVQKTFIPASFVKWALGGMFTLCVLYVVHLEQVEHDVDDELHRLDNLAVEKIQMQRQINKNVEASLNRHELFLGIKQVKIGAK